ncbi:MAG: glycosyltransferase [Candidatus Omnitrophica bacterium]|nr:glycosyltransferase [Candidatus Omnitrophota bacterium]MDD5550067.1 glycosyltransferase [Candidatus Omnitrophota bacterium]
MDKKILLMYITNVSGHHSATMAIEKAINAFNPHPQVLNIDGFGYTNPIMEKVTHAIYMGVINKAPAIWDFLYDNPAVARRISNLRQSVYRKNRDKIKRLIETENCKVVICSQAFPCGMVADYKKHCNPDIKLIAVVTDFMPHAYWVYDEIDFYTVGSEEARKALLKKGVADNKIKLWGIPIDPRFSEPLDKYRTAAELNINLDKPVILIMGGGRGIGPIKQLINTLDKSKINAHFLIVTGINKRLYDYLKNSNFRNKMHIYGYIGYVDKLMTIADILITKPGGVTTAEALAKYLPMLIVQPLPGQEQNNTNFLVKQGVVQKADNIKDAVERLVFLLNNPRELDSIKEKISRIAKPLSSQKIAELALRLC